MQPCNNAGSLRCTSHVHRRRLRPFGWVSSARGILLTCHITISCIARCGGSFVLPRATNSPIHALCALPVSKTYDAEIFQQTDNCSNYVLTDRRECLSLLALGASAVINADAVSAEETKLGETTVTLPLEPASGGTFCVRFTLHATQNDGRSPDDSFRLYRAIVDTGSPFLVLPSSGPRNEEKKFPWIRDALAASSADEDSRWLSGSEYPPTEEVYGAVRGQVSWKLANYMFRDPRLQIASLHDNRYGVVGVLDEALTNEATGGGRAEPYALLGLIKSNNPNADRGRFPDPRPSFLEQESLLDGNEDSDVASNKRQITSFAINGPMRELTLSTQSLIPDKMPDMPLTDLRAYGDYVDHYAVVVDSVSFDGISVSSRTRTFQRPIVAVFDTGLTGCLLKRDFWVAVKQHLLSKGVAIADLKSVSLTIREEVEKQKRNGGSRTRMIGSGKDEKGFYVQPIDLDWFDDDRISPFTIILGQTFLRKGTLTIDIDRRRAIFT